MNTEHNVERVLQRWLVDGIDEMPDRVYLSILDRVERQPQQRAWRVSWRDSHVNTYFKPLLAVAAIVVVAVAGFALLRPSGAGVGGLDVAASPSPSSIPLPPPLPDGRLEAGDYVLRAVTGDPMAFTITAPEGWTGFGEFFIGGPAPIQSRAPDGIGISVNHNPQVVADPCGPHDEDPAVTQSIDDIIAALSARADLQVSGVTDTTLAGYSGKRLDIQFPDRLGCDNHYIFAEPKGLYANGLANRWRVWLLDADGETAVVVLLDYVGTPAEDRAAARAAIDSIRITP